MFRFAAAPATRATASVAVLAQQVRMKSSDDAAGAPMGGASQAPRQFQSTSNNLADANSVGKNSTFHRTSPQSATVFFGKGESAAGAKEPWHITGGTGGTRIVENVPCTAPQTLPISHRMNVYENNDSSMAPDVSGIPSQGELAERQAAKYGYLHVQPSGNAQIEPQAGYDALKVSAGARKKIF